MYGCDVCKVFYYSYEIYGLWVRVLVFWVKLIRLYWENV